MSSTFCALGKKSSNSEVGLPMPMVTVLPFTPSKTIARYLNPFPAPHRPIGVPEEVYFVGGGILPDDVVELYTLDSSYGGWLRFLGVEVGMVLEPTDHILGGLYHLW